MSRKPKPLPHFRSEEEELRFWDEHSPADYFTEPAPDITIKLTRRKVARVREAGGSRPTRRSTSRH